MSTGKLDQSLDDILKTRRTKGRGRGPRRSGAGRPATSEAPVGGVHKSTKQAKPVKAAANAPAVAAGEARIMISNLPLDVEEAQLKEYFISSPTLGKPKKILMQYGPNGRSLGSATVIFAKADQATKAVQALDNIRIDNRLIKVDLLVSARNAPATTAQNSLADRVTQPKKADKPKPATATKSTGAAAAGGRAGRKGSERGRGRGGRGGRPGREKKKTVEELDAEMEDYFPTAEGGNGNDAMVTNGGAAPVGNDTAMDDEML